MAELTEAASEIATLQGFMPTKDTFYAVYIDFYFPTMNSDIDGPIKRTLDAIFRGLKNATGSPYADDRRVTRLFTSKMFGREFEPKIHIELTVSPWP